MKKISIFLAAMFASLSLMADGVLTISPNPVVIGANDRVDLEFIFESDGEFKGFQMDVTMPEGIKAELDEGEIICDKGDLFSSVKRDDHTVSSSHLESGSDRFICVSMKDKIIPSGKGTVMYVSYESGAMSTGTYKGKISGIEFNTTDNKRVLLDDIEFDIMIVPTKVNGVGSVKTVKKTFNLAGQQLKTPAKGVNIIDGKKVIVK